MRLLASSRLLGSLDMAEGMEQVARIGYDGIEIWHEQLSPKLVGQMRRLCPPRFVVSVHAASVDINLTSTNSRIAAASLAEVHQSIEWAAEMDARCVVVHPGRMSSTKDDPRSYVARQAAAFAQILEAAGRHGLCVAVENMERRSRELVVSPDEMRALLDRVADRDLLVCLDTAHAFTAGGTDAFLKAPWADRIAHYHVSHSMPPTTHVPLDQGTTTLTPQLRETLADFSGAVVVEGAPHGAIDAVELLARNRIAFASFLSQGGT